MLRVTYLQGIDFPGGFFSSWLQKKEPFWPSKYSMSYCWWFEKSGDHHFEVGSLSIYPIFEMVFWLYPRWLGTGFLNHQQVSLPFVFRWDLSPESSHPGIHPTWWKLTIHRLSDSGTNTIWAHQKIIVQDLFLHRLAVQNALVENGSLV